jgi:hypothetical protein
VRIAHADVLAMACVALLARTAFTPQLRAIRPNACKVPHWFYVFAGRLHVGYNDVRVDVGNSGETVCAAPGQTACQ